MISSKDRDIYNFLDLFNVATTSQLYRMFYRGKTLRRCQDRLTALSKSGYINRVRNFLTGEYLYYVKSQKPEQMEHCYFRTELFLKMRERYTIKFYDTECLGMVGVRPDMYMEVQLRNALYLFFVEIHLHNKFNQDKYENYYKSGQWKERTKIFPRILIVAHNKPTLKPSSLNYRIVPTSLTGIDTAFN